MADRVVKVLTPSDTYDLLSLDELKVAMEIPSTDNSQDELLSQYITRYSDVIATTCNRVFAYEEVAEIWRCTNVDYTNGMKRLFVTHYPIDPAATMTLESPSGSVLDPSTYAVEEKSGKIELLQTWAEPITVTYSGGYDLPEEAPPALKQAAELMIREGQALAQRMLNSGVRSISHRESRVQFFDPLTLLTKTQGFGFATTAANALLMHYVRFEV
ncbi:hypothetical protein SAMN05443247_06554 [Bradyrhizobium erythrophlei]|nr:hypothetical protein SAMN05443247_06554 [Bradyrhizobium erythrophlei]